jgi:hypothetical protein
MLVVAWTTSNLNEKKHERMRTFLSKKGETSQALFVFLLTIKENKSSGSVGVHWRDPLWNRKTTNSIFWLGRRPFRRTWINKFLLSGTILTAFDAARSSCRGGAVIAVINVGSLLLNR